MMTYEEVLAYVRHEARQAEITQVGSYESEPFATFNGLDEHGNDIVEDTTVTVSVDLLGDVGSGFILRTSDEADGRTDEMGTDVYPTAVAAIEALLIKADLLPAGEAILWSYPSVRE